MQPVLGASRLCVQRSSMAAFGPYNYKALGQASYCVYRGGISQLSKSLYHSSAVLQRGKASAYIKKQKRKFELKNLGLLGSEAGKIKRNDETWPSDGDMNEKFAKSVLNTRLKTFKLGREAKQRCSYFGISDDVFAEWAEKFIEGVNSEKVERLTPKDVVPILRTNGVEILDNLIVNQFFAFLEREAPMTIKNVSYLRKITDMRHPYEWHPNARMKRRKIIMHVGPTNSGKTYHALKRLEGGGIGLYCSPLRLLAYEVYSRMTNAGISCGLVTGEDRRIPDYESGKVKPAGYDIMGTPIASVISCTIEMIPNGKFSVAVIDEIQMISDKQRGWAWTNALLSIAAKEIHLCGEPSAVPIVKRICEDLDEEVEVREYNRLGELKVSNKSLYSKWKNIKKGDCVVAFSRKKIFEIKKLIEKDTKMRCAMIYGSLPPETRAEQARLFNDPDSGYDVLVASDAVGMGINLNIKRVVFTEVSKYDGESVRNINVSQTRQIGGRAGRFSSTENVGYVTSFNEEDLSFVRTTMNRMPPVLSAAGLKPPIETIELFSHQFPKVSFSQLWNMFCDISSIDTKYFLCSFKDQIEIANAIESAPLMIRDRYQFLYAPINCRDKLVVSCLQKYANAVAYKQVCKVTDVIKLPTTIVSNRDGLMILESWHRSITLYLWLSFHFPEAFPQYEEASEIKGSCESMIQEGLNRIRTKKIKDMKDK